MLIKKKRKGLKSALARIHTNYASSHMSSASREKRGRGSPSVSTSGSRCRGVSSTGREVLGKTQIRKGKGRLHTVFGRNRGKRGLQRRDQFLRSGS